ncbi:TVP38/TMEM64 family protein [Gilvimarinus sp. F26214L]|uniref:TVP38/TMEM64 family protein n=1 Tax=Gilvimarinus sp. DZF01 TaxID=3461371 RepID=UPI00404644F1
MPPENLREEERAALAEAPVPARAVLALVAGIVLVVAAFQVPEEFWQELLSSNYIRSDLGGFILLSSIYVVAILLMAPLSPFPLSAGMVFGFAWGTFLALLALNTGAALAFFIARYLLPKKVIGAFSRNGKMAVVARAMRGDAVLAIALLRLNPIVPFNVQNYVCGATGVNFARYSLGTFLGSAPFTVALVYLGYAGRKLMLATGLQVEQWTLLLFAAGVILTIPMTWLLLRKTIRRIRESRNDQIATDED